MARGCALIDSRLDTAKIGSDGRVEVHRARLLAVFGGTKNVSTRPGSIATETIFPCHVRFALGWSAQMTRFARESDVFQYIDGAHRAKVDIGCRSIHILIERKQFFAKGRVPKRDALATQSYGRYRPTACRSDVRVTGQDNLCPSNMPPCGSFTSLGGSAISDHGAASTVQVTPWENCGSSGPTKTLRSLPCC